jgi:hypothetical protein
MRAEGENGSAARAAHARLPARQSGRSFAHPGRIETREFTLRRRDSKSRWRLDDALGLYRASMIGAIMALWPKRECAPAPLRGIERDESRSNRVGIKREFMPCALFCPPASGAGRAA